MKPKTWERKRKLREEKMVAAEIRLQEEEKGLLEYFRERDFRIAYQCWAEGHWWSDRIEPGQLICLTCGERKS